MSPAQIKLLRRLIDAERVHRDDPGVSEWIEVGSFVGISLRTVENLGELVETMSENGITTLARLRRDLG